MVACAANTRISALVHARAVRTAPVVARGLHVRITNTCMRSDSEFSAKDVAFRGARSCDCMRGPVAEQ
eukprot:6186550-Pleurochrysis_carterae.AAC.4